MKKVEKISPNKKLFPMLLKKWSKLGGVLLLERFKNGAEL